MKDKRKKSAKREYNDDILKRKKEKGQRKKRNIH